MVPKLRFLTSASRRNLSRGVHRWFESGADHWRHTSNGGDDPGSGTNMAELVITWGSRRRGGFWIEIRTVRISGWRFTAESTHFFFFGDIMRLYVCEVVEECVCDEWDKSFFFLSLSLSVPTALHMFMKICLSSGRRPSVIDSHLRSSIIFFCYLNVRPFLHPLAGSEKKPILAVISQYFIWRQETFYYELEQQRGIR